MVYPLPGLMSHLESLRALYYLGPLFSVLFISDLPKVILHGSTIALYVDDCNCSRIIDMAGDLELF